MKTLIAITLILCTCSTFANPVGGVLGGAEGGKEEKQVKEKQTKVNDETKPCKKIDENAEYVIWQCKK